MHHHTELPFVDEFRWVSPLHYLKNGWWILQGGPPALHYYCAVVLHSCIVLPLFGPSSNHEHHCCQLKNNRATFRIYMALLVFPLNLPLILSFYFFVVDFTLWNLQNYKGILGKRWKYPTCYFNTDRPTWCHLLYYFTVYCSTCFEC